MEHSFISIWYDIDQKVAMSFGSVLCHVFSNLWQLDSWLLIVDDGIFDDHFMAGLTSTHPWPGEICVSCCSSLVLTLSRWVSMRFAEASSKRNQVKNWKTSIQYDKIPWQKNPEMQSWPESYQARFCISCATHVGHIPTNLLYAHVSHSIHVGSIYLHY